MLRLNNKENMPAIAFGVGTKWYKCPKKHKASMVASLTAALDAGFLHFDEAEMYANEIVTGQTIAAWLARTGRCRSELFITHKGH